MEKECLSSAEMTEDCCSNRHSSLSFEERKVEERFDEHSFVMEQLCGSGERERERKREKNKIVE